MKTRSCAAWLVLLAWMPAASIAQDERVAPGLVLTGSAGEIGSVNFAWDAAAVPVGGTVTRDDLLSLRIRIQLADNSTYTFFTLEECVQAELVPADRFMGGTFFLTCENDRPWGTPGVNLLTTTCFTGCRRPSSGWP